MSFPRFCVIIPHLRRKAMRMLAALILGAGLLLRSAILVSGHHFRILRTYRWFYLYILSGIAGDIAVAIALRTASPWYRVFYWTAQFLTMLFGCAVVLEIFSHVLKPYPGAERFARALVLSTFAAIFLVPLTYARISNLAAAGSFIQLERDARTAQIFFLVLILAVIFHYGIPSGRNMRGMICGYGLYVGASLFILAFRAYVGSGLDEVWRVVQPLCSALALCIWLHAMWGYYPAAIPEHEIALESDYEALASKTRNAVQAIRTHVRAIRP